MRHLTNKGLIELNEKENKEVEPEPHYFSLKKMQEVFFFFKGLQIS